MVIVFVYSTYESPGIEYLSAVLKAAGHETHLLYDPRLFGRDEGLPTSKLLARWFDQRKLFRQQLKDYRPDLVAFSVVSADYLWACETAKMIKGWMDVPIVFGNIHPTVIPEKVLQNDFVDFVVVGEGEYALLDLVESLAAQKRDYSIQNVWSKREGEIVSNPLRPLISDLDSLPFPDRDLFRRVGRPFDIGIMALGRRGCKNACPYCSNSFRRKLYFGEDYQNPAYLRRRSVGNLIRELKEAKEKYNYKLIRFNDDDLAENEQWLKEIYPEYTREIGVPYKCYVNPESINENTIRYLKESNCGEIQFGMQSINPRTRREVLRRYYSNEQVARVIRLIRESGIQFFIDNLVGIPGDSVEDLVDMVKYYTENPGGYINTYWLLYFAGHDMVQVGKDRGMIDDCDEEKFRASPFSDTNVIRPEVHRRLLERYQILARVYNYFPLSVTRFIIKHKLYRFFPAFDFTLFFRRLRIFKITRKDAFPNPKDGFELIHLRRRDEYLFHLSNKIKYLFGWGWLRRAH